MKTILILSVWLLGYYLGVEVSTSPSISWLIGVLTALISIVVNILFDKMEINCD